ncbi:uncharacterized protein C2845_PMPSC055587 [Panicum miliaceum]|uniref:Uncharacterized protein n=1 Tax=Panicum miliaceum TaxID=4540 RepID=A0A3L6PCN4_PANMI|nr:uncharacterized protein C2845_PMPSC055587 [Panicum miliaceum]
MRSASSKNAAQDDVGEEVTSPLKQKEASTVKENIKTVPRQLFQNKKGDQQRAARKRKSKVAPASSPQPRDTNQQEADASALVPAFLVSSRVNQHAAGGLDGTKDALEVMIKKQKCSTNTTNARSAAVAEGSPRRAQ